MLSLKLQLAAHAALLSTTPAYEVPPEAPEILRRNGVRLALVSGDLDIYHRDIERWAAGRKTLDAVCDEGGGVGGGGGGYDETYKNGAAEVSIWRSWWRTHEIMCQTLDFMQLH